MEGKKYEPTAEELAQAEERMNFNQEEATKVREERLKALEGGHLVLEKGDSGLVHLKGVVKGVEVAISFSKMSEVEEKKTGHKTNYHSTMSGPERRSFLERSYFTAEGTINGERLASKDAEAIVRKYAGFAESEWDEQLAKSANLGVQYQGEQFEQKN